MCTKRPYDSFAECDVVVQVMKRKKNDLFCSYECKECGKWHVGHLIPKKTRAIHYMKKNSRGR